MTYDPCTCQVPSELAVEVFLIREGIKDLYKTILVHTPGSNWPGYLGAAYPYYNEVLGVMNLLETPKFDVRLYQRSQFDPETGLNYEADYRHQVQLHEDLSYVLNPAALDTSRFEIAGSLLITWNPDCHPENFKGLIQLSPTTYRTPFLPISCLRDYIVDYEVDTENSQPWSCAPTDIKIKLVANLKAREPVSDRDVPFEGLFETKRTLVPYPAYPAPLIPENPFPDLLGDRVTLANIELEAGKTYYATESFEIGPGVTVANGGTVTLIAANEITVLPGVELLPGIVLQTGLPKLCDRKVFPQRQERINQICSSRAYLDRSKPTFVPVYVPPVQVQVNPLFVYPNAFTDQLTLEFALPADGLTNARLVDALGRQVQVLWENRTYKAGKQTVSVDINPLAGGMYFVVLDTPNGQKAVRVMKR